MNIIVANDHAGYALKEKLKQWLAEANYTVEDIGAFSEDSVDYPDFAHKLSERVKSGEFEIGILICGSGNGVSMAANKHSGIRAALAWLPEIATLARQHNNANVLSLPARFITEEQAKEIVFAFLNAKFEGGRHENRVNKISR
ncbi:MAG: ribose 5-phosphate isomerase B [Bacteroidia bacterium]